ncbi:hypothetical protein NFI96_023742 [Prochilodus magdalenae]|nr:hypothetical protein NFI96_023742 [Prochilodus magdalenae]
MRGALCCILACCLFLIHTSPAAAEAESIPRELIERLSSSEIRSISDLQRLLESQSLEQNHTAFLCSSTSERNGGLTIHGTQQEKSPIAVKLSENAALEVYCRFYKQFCYGT